MHTEASVPPARRPAALWLAAVLLLVMGVSGLLVGVELLSVAGSHATGTELVAFAIAAGILAYGGAALVAGAGIFRLHRWAHRLALVVLAIGIVELGWQAWLIGFEAVTLFGLGYWVLVLALLLAPAVRAAVGRR